MRLEPLAQVEGGSTIYFVHPDHLNTPQKITDGSRNVVWDRQQEPFGEECRSSEPDAAAASR